MAKYCRWSRVVEDTLLAGTIDAIASVHLWNIRSLDLIVDYSDNRALQRIYGECLHIPY